MGEREGWGETDRQRQIWRDIDSDAKRRRETQRQTYGQRQIDRQTDRDRKRNTES